jgi:polyhydroxybutyrate depolymerase
MTDDVSFLSSAIATLEQTQCINPSKVYATGVSNGAGMVALLGCRLSLQITAIAPVEGDYDGQPACRPSRPESLLEIHGTADRIAPYYGPRAKTSASGVPAALTGWVQRDGCVGRPTTRLLAPRTKLFTWGGCNGVSVEHIKIQGGGHQWPGSDPPDPGPTATICASCAIWSFFAALPVAQSSTGGAGLPG